ncbi:MAG: M42 family metallopeptidase [Flavobacteriales bacterium]|nr:M42 family metallopeptidase [Flavobacteriales bacterium]MCX7767605.1 M42 family metallopeptidase [Flavobacteriales bacterium]MDW8409553.1 M42 family metallopeptidase [Flavobacteriales bacterium]
MNLRTESRAFLEKYLNNPSPTGFEWKGQQIWLEYLKPYIDGYELDVYGSVAAVLNPGTSYRVVIEAHADEISWFVNYISEEGFIYVIRNGGSDHQIAPSMRVYLHGDKGIVEGVFGWPAIHVRKPDKEEPPSLKNIIIDVGASSREEVLEMGIHPGTVITYQDKVTYLNNKFLTGRALDNRIGGFIIAEVARILREKNFQLPYTLYVVNSVQEEIGLRGAEMISRRLKPDVALVTDVCHDTSTPQYEPKEQGDQRCGRGPVLTYGPAVHNKLLQHLIEVAKKNNIPFQYAAVSRSTGTDTDAFAYSGEGVASALISLPLRYMHTTVETIHLGDLQRVIDLIVAFLMDLKAGTSYKYF